MSSLENEKSGIITIEPEDVESSQKARKIIENLRETIRYHDHKYYVEAAPQISDAQYDELFRTLQKLEKKFPKFKSENSPTQRVGAPPVDELLTVEHESPMLSLDSTLNPEEVQDFDRYLIDQLGHDEFTYWSELKFDGFSVELVYNGEEFEYGATRGDGYEGEDVTENLRTIGSIPLVLDEHEKHDIPERLAVRGEVFMPLDKFHEMNEERAEAGKDPFANPRNAAAGTVRQLDSKIVAKRPLDIFVYDIMEVQGIALETQQEVFNTLPGWGFKVNNQFLHTASIEEIIEFRHQVASNREDLNFEIDGTVIKVNELEVREELGTRQASPRWALAYKFEPRKEVTNVKRIGIQVGRTGKLTPVAFLDPVDVSGVTISRASMHNYDFVDEKDIRSGDKVRVERAGDVIPYVAERVEEDDSDRERSDAFKMPDQCPRCGSDVAEEGAYHVCTGGTYCPAQLQGHLEHFVSRDAMDIEGIGEKEIKELREKNLVTNIADLYKLDKSDLLKVDHFTNETYVRIRQESNNPELAYVIHAVDPPGVGAKTAMQLANHFDRIKTFLKADVEDFEQAGLSNNRARKLAETINKQDINSEIENYSNNPREAEADVGKALFNFLKEREKSKDTTLDRFIYALGIHHVGSHVSTILARSYENIDQIMETSESKLREIHEIGPQVAESVVHFFSDEKNRKIIHELLNEGVQPRPIKNESGDTLEGTTFVFTGGLIELSREEAQNIIESLGGRATSSVSSNTDYLVVGENPGSTKLSDAEDYSTSRLNEDEFYNYIENKSDMNMGNF